MFLLANIFFCVRVHNCKLTILYANQRGLYAWELIFEIPKQCIVRLDTTKSHMRTQVQLALGTQVHLALGTQVQLALGTQVQL